MRTLRLVIHYFVLVALPFLGVLVVMNLGDRIEPPSPVDGKWELQAELDRNVNTGCAGRLSGFEEPVIAIAQSGVFLQMQIPNALSDTLAGRMDGNRISASTSRPLIGGDQRDLLRLSATLSIQGSRQMMTGVMEIPERPGCMPIRFVAERVTAKQASR